MSRRRWSVLLWALSACVVLLLLVKFFVADVYRVDSGSMRPTLFGGRERPDGDEEAERVLVLYGTGRPERFDLAVIRSPDGSKPLVKRVCGLPYDQDLMIRDGDLFVGRRRLPANAPRPPPVAVYDDRYLEPERFFEFRRDGSVRRDSVRHGVAEWVVEGDAHPPGNLLLFHPELRDDYLDGDHRRVQGVVEVNDARLELEFALESLEVPQTLRFQLTEEGDLFEAELALAPRAAPTLRLLRVNRPLLRAGDEPGAGRELGRAESAVVLTSGERYDLSFSNIDNHLRVRSRALALDLAHSYDANVALHEDTQPAGAAPRNLGSRVRFGVQGGRARFGAVRVLRDLYYTEDGRVAVRGPGAGRPGASDGPEPVRDSISLGPDDYFLLGDNSAASTDSRHFGPVKGHELLGRPLAVVFPEPRWLRATEPP
jgi:signal peptidase I